MKSFIINGQVRDSKTQKGIPNLKVEAWDKDLLFNDIVGSAITDDSGEFRIEFSEAHFREWFLDRKPDLFFKVYKGCRLITSTEKTVLWNIKKKSKSVAIEVELTQEEETGGLIVRGTIRYSDKRPLAEAVVRAADKELRHEKNLGETATDDQGHYEIHYTHDQFRRAEKRNADLIVRVFDPETGSLLLAESEIIYNAGPVEVMDLIVTRSFSEYEKYMAELIPVRDNVPVGDLTAEDIQFLHHETGIAAQHIEYLSIAARLGKQTEMPPELFYGLFRQGIPTTLSDLLEEDTETLRNALMASFKAHIIPLRLQENLDDYLERLSKLKETDPGIHRKQQKDKLRRLGKVADLDDAKMEAVVNKAAYPAMVTDKLLASMVENGELQDSEAKDIGLTVSLFQLFDEDEKLAEAVKKSDFPQLPQGKIHRLHDLTAFAKEDWHALLEQAETEPPPGFSREGYAALLAKKIENLYPSKTMLAQVTVKATDGVAEGLETLRPLFERNEPLFGREDFGNLIEPDTDPDTQENLRQAHTRLKALVNTYPGLCIAEILDDRQLSANAKEERIAARIELLTRFHAQNQNKEFLFLDYSPESPDLNALDFENFSTDEQRMVLKMVKAYQRMYSVTRDATHTRDLLEKGHFSPLGIANMSRKAFVESLGVDTPVGDAYYRNACNMATDMSVGAFGLQESFNANGPWAWVDNTDYQSLSEYLRKIDGWEALFGNLDYCKCEHCRSIFSPAAYLVDLMRFLEKNVYFIGRGGGDEVAWETSAGFRAREEHPLHLRQRRPDLWQLPLTCENTNQLIPYLDIINEVLENYIALDTGIADGPDDGRLAPDAVDRQDLANDVYGRLYDSVRSFKQPFLLAMERLAIYLAHFDLTREEITRLLEEPRDVIAGAALMLSKKVRASDDLKREFELITERNTALEHLISLYGLDFENDASAGELVFYDPTLQPTDEVYEESRNDVQLLLKAMGLRRAELEQLIMTEFVRTEYGMVILGGGESVEIHSEKRVPEGDDASVQNDIERIHGLSERSLERMHRFTRLWRHVPWSIKELDLVLKKLAGLGADNGITAAMLQDLADILSMQRRFNLTVEELCTWWGSFPDQPVVEDKQSLFDRLFNLPDFVRLNGTFPKTDTFVHPAFREAIPPEVDYPLHRLLAGLRVDDEQLYQLITGLILPLGLDDTKEFPLSRGNLSLLYRHARIAEALNLPIPHLFQLIRLAPAVPTDHISGLPDLAALIDFSDWWQSTEYTLDDLGFITAGPVVKIEAYPDAEALTAKLLRQARTNQVLTFTHTVFAFLEGVTEEQSQKIIEEHTGAIIQVTGTGYRVARAFGPALPIRIPEEMGILADEDDIREVLVSHVSDEEPFDNSLFTTIERVSVTEEQSRALFTANLGIFDKAPGVRYRAAEGFNDMSEIVIPDIPIGEAPIDAEPAAVRDLLLTYRTDSLPVFDDTLFTAIGGVTEEQSRAIVAANPQWIVPAPLENAYWLTSSYSSASVIIEPDMNIPTTETSARGLLSTYHATDIIPNYLAAELGLPVEKINALINLANINLTDPIYTEALKSEASDQCILDLVTTLLPLTTLFKHKAFDKGALGFVQEDLARFDIADITAIGMETVHIVSIFLDFLKKLDGRELERRMLFDLLVAFLPSEHKFYIRTTSDKQAIQQLLAQVLDAEVGLAITAHDEIALAETALDALAKLDRCLELAKRLGVGGDVLKLIVSNDYETLNKAANAVLSAFRAKYNSEEEWQEKIQPFEDKIRSRKRDALTDYLIHSLDPKPFSTLHDLYHHFLIDVELEGCARTSRVVAANSSVQLYMHRILMNLEQDRAGGLKACVEDEDAVEEWKWRKNYRVWEANRKVFLYPENYIEPDLRDNKTPLFKELESTLLQQEINEETVLEAYAKYMRGFDELANLKIAGSYHDKGDDGDFLHLFGVTSSEPPVYYYRVVENAYWGEKAPEIHGIAWHPWRKIDVQIPVRKVSPIVFKEELYVFWIEITTRPYNVVLGGTSTFLGYQHKMTLKYAKLRLDGTWTPPQKVSLYGQEPFDSGDGVIIDPMEEQNTDAGTVYFPHYSAIDVRYGLLDVHHEPKALEDYTLRGFPWDQVYPFILNNDRLMLTGRDFQMRSVMDFYGLRIGPRDSFWTVDGFFSAPGTLNVFPERRLLCSKDLVARQTVVLSHGLPPFLLTLDPYAHASIVIEQRRLDYYSYYLGGGWDPSFVESMTSGLYENRIAELICYEPEITPVNGSLSDGLVNCEGDLLYIQDDPNGSSNYLIKRLGTTQSKAAITSLFLGGINALLASQYELAENGLPLMREGSYDSEDRSNAGTLDFTGPYGVYYREIFFHIPFLIANHLNSQGKFAEAQNWYHYLFDPTAQATGTEHRPADRNWRYREFRENDVESMRATLESSEAIDAYKKDPFNPHAIARLRLSAYQKAIVMKYIDNLLDWGEHLFAQDTMESINEATLLYVSASDILGERPSELGECGETNAWSYAAISPVLDEQGSEFLIEMYHVINPGRSDSGTFDYSYSQNPSLIHSATKNAHDHITMRGCKTAGQQMAAMGLATTEESASAPITSERMMISQTENVLDKEESLFQGTHWMGVNKKESNWKGVVGFVVPFAYQLGPIFCIPPNRELHGYWDRVDDRLFKIRNCMNISGVRRQLALFAPEISPMLLVRAKAAGLSLEDVLNSISGDLPPYRFSYLIERAKGYAAMLQGFGAALLSALEKKDVENLNLIRVGHQDKILKMTSRVREEEYAAALETVKSLERRMETVEYRKTYYAELFDTGLIDEEETQQSARKTAQFFEVMGEATNLLAAIGYLVPQLGSFFALTYGGKQTGASGAMFAQWMRSGAAIANSVAASVGLEAGFKRREQGWQHQRDLADKEISEIEKQIEIANIRAEITDKLRQIHYETIEQQSEIYEFYRDKFSNLGLYTWLSTNVQGLFKTAYNNAYAMAKLAERAYRFERGDDAAELIGPNHWDASRAGLLAGERLLIGLQNLERRFIETNYRSFEIDQSFSLTQIAPDALIQLKETGECGFTVPEIFYDLFYPGHYKRKIRSARLTVPCITGPYTNVSATLQLKESWIRTEPKLNISLHQVPRSRTVAIATSTAQNDAGVFELNFRDERYMPFEGAGAVSSWQLSLPKNFRQFDYQTINDVIIHISYTAAQDQGLRAEVETGNAALEGSIRNVLAEPHHSLSRVFSFRQEFSSEFNRLLHSPADTSVKIKISDKHFPIFLKGFNLNIVEAVLILNTPKIIDSDGTSEDQSIANFRMSIDGSTSDEIAFTRLEDQWGGLPYSDISALLADTMIDDHTIRIVNGGDLSLDPLIPPDVSIVDSKKLSDIYLFIRYGI